MTSKEEYSEEISIPGTIELIQQLPWACCEIPGDI